MIKVLNKCKSMFLKTRVFIFNVDNKSSTIYHYLQRDIVKCDSSFIMSTGKYHDKKEIYDMYDYTQSKSINGKS